MNESNTLVQNPSKCQFCLESDIQWICLNCDLFLCPVCNKRIHSIGKICQNHEIISLTDLDTDIEAASRRKVDLQNMICDIHPDQKCVMYCVGCNLPICLKCSYEMHQDHKLSDLTETYMNKFSKIKNLKLTADEDFTFFNHEVMTHKNKMNDTKKEYESVKSAILKREEEVKDAVAKHRQKLIDELDKMFKPSEDKIMDVILEVRGKTGEVEKARDSYKSILMSHQAADILETTDSVKIKTPEKHVNIIPVTLTKFQPGYSLDSRMNDVFGNVYGIPEHNLVNTFQTCIKSVIAIVSCGTNEKLIGSYASEKLQRVKIEREAILVIKEENIKVYDMSMMRNGDLVISSWDNELRIYSKDGNFKAFKTFSSLLTWGIHVNKCDEILVGLTEPGFIDVTTNSIRKVVVLNQSGEIKHTYEYDKNDQRLFTGPFRIVTLSGIICIIDRFNNSGEGRVVAINNEGCLQWVYPGDGQIHESKDKFYPRGIAVTSINMVLVSDNKNHSIHVLNTYGQITVRHQLITLGIEFPFSLYFDRDRLLWVGCSLRETVESNRNAKIYVLQL